MKYITTDEYFSAGHDRGNFKGIIYAKYSGNGSISLGYYENDLCHRIGGPAFISSTGEKRYYIYNIFVTKEKHDFYYSVYLESEKEYFDLLKYEGLIK